LRPAGHTARKPGAGAAVRISAPAQRTHAPPGAGTYQTAATSNSLSGAAWRCHDLVHGRANARPAVTPCPAVVPYTDGIGDAAQNHESRAQSSERAAVFAALE